VPRPLSGPVRLSGSATLYARFDVPRKLHAKARAAGIPLRTHRSLKTTSMAIARQRWIPVLAELRRETLAAIQAGRRLVDLDREEVLGQLVHVQGEEPVPIGQSPWFSMEDIATLVTDSRPGSQAHEEALQQLLGRPTWAQLLEAKDKAATARRGRSLSQGWRHQAQIAIAHAERAGFSEPTTMGKQEVRALMAKLDATGMQPVTRAKTLSLLSGLLQVAVDEDLVESNPFRLVSFAAASRVEGGRRAFTDEELRVLWPQDPAIRVLACLGLRVSELYSRTRADLVDGVLVIDDRGDFRVKTRSSRRRLPVPGALLPDLEAVLADRRTTSRKGQRLRDLVREHFEDQALVPHSLRHSWYTLARRAGVLADVQAELAGHSPVHRVQGGYGSFHDGVLLQALQSIHQQAQEAAEGR